MRLLEKAAELLKSNIPGVTNIECPGFNGNEIQVIAALPSAQLAARVQAMTTMRIPGLEGLLAKGILEFQKLGLKKNQIPVIIISAPRAGGEAMKAAAAFMDRHAPKSGWAIFDLVGTVRI